MGRVGVDYVLAGGLGQSADRRMGKERSYREQVYSGGIYALRVDYDLYTRTICLVSNLIQLYILGMLHSRFERWSEETVNEAFMTWCSAGTNLTVSWYRCACPW